MRNNLRILILMDTDRTYERDLVKGILKYGSFHGHFEFMRSESQALGGLHELKLEKIRKWKPDGVCWREGHPVHGIEKLKLPTIYFPLTKPVKRNANVMTSDYEIGFMAGRHLLQRGLTNFAYCGLSDDYYWSLGRKEGFKDAISEADMSVESFELLSGRQKLERWLADLPHPVGLMVCTDDCSVEVYKALDNLGLRVPDDIAVVGVGNDEIVCDFSTPPLSSVKLNLEEAGFRAASLLEGMIRKHEEKQDIEVQVFDVVERQSSNFIAIEDKLVAQALQFIRDNRSKRISVEDVVAAVPASRRLLYRRFKEHLGRSIAHEIRRVRMNHAAVMLTNTNFSIAEICEQMGFDAPQNFSRTFMREKGITPYKYRAKYARFI